MSNVYSDTRVLFAAGPQTPLYKSMQEYANKPDVQELLQKLTADMVCEKPEDPLGFMELWVKKAKEQRSNRHNQAT
ncbi:hypothetical protein DUNSADRAFT_1751 [Dunaliella salina]|uniref:Uncharacterized protein n=1 Tax=Dunaliella salina TaxID=3046 RepID=A0ABQ7GWR8_DUNSA|nr:hypothetical protein DUNSADRAFT_1751 [Dunaliella salina]|eukprot:KAF5839054.1 hypothetical protein DUNSADRAFT_1751 [Dunaliella salina]